MLTLCTFHLHALLLLYPNTIPLQGHTRECQNETTYNNMDTVTVLYQTNCVHCVHCIIISMHITELYLATVSKDGNHNACTDLKQECQGSRDHKQLHCCERACI